MKTSGGSISKRQRADGSTAWEARLDLGVDPHTKKRIRKTGWFDRQRDAQKALNEWRADRDAGLTVLPNDTTLENYLRWWLHEYKSLSLADSTLEDYRWWINKHINPDLGTYRIQDITTAQLQVWVKEKSARLSTRSLVYIRGILSQAFSHAIKLGLVSRSPVTDVGIPRTEGIPTVIWQRDDVKKFLTVVRNDPYYALWVLALSTGMRRGELLGLSWRNVNLEEGVIRISQSLVTAYGKPVLHAPKTKAGRRTIPISVAVIEALEEHKARLHHTSGDMVFTTFANRMVHPDYLTRRFFKLIRKARLPEIRFHDLRHTAASFQLAKGQSIVDVSTRLGHRDSSVTLQVYGHMISGGARALADTIDDLME